MKQNKLLSFTLIAVSALIISSCGSSRSYSSSQTPQSLTHVSLIITPSPGFTMNSYPDGRYYHRSPQGFMYWKGNDNRFFLDKKYVSRVNYNKWEYNEWKRWYEQNNKYNNRRHSY
jgi:hypothetical protein